MILSFLFTVRSFFPVFTNDTPKYKEIEMMIDYLKKEDK